MRLIFYFLVVISLFIVLVSNDRPIQSWMRNVRTDKELSLQQNALAKADQTMTFLKSTLTIALNSLPSASRLRVAMIHSAISPTGETVLQWSIAGYATAPGHEPGQALINQPLTQWSDYLGRLLSHECAFVLVNDITNTTVKKRLDALNMDAFLVCPIFNKNSQLIGGIFVSWDDMLDVPKDLEPTKRVLRATASVIGEGMKTADYMNLSG